MGVNTNYNEFYNILPVTLLTSTLFFPIGSRIAHTVNCKITIFAGGMIIITSFSTAIWTTNPILFGILISLIFGIGKSFIYSSSLQAASTHLKGRNGFAMGVVVSGLGSASFLFGLVCTHLVNPDNEPLSQINPENGEMYFSPEINSRVPFMLKVVTVTFVVLLIISMLTISEFKPDPASTLRQSLLAENRENENPEFTPEDDSKYYEKEAKVKDILQCREFWHIFFIAYTYIFFGFYIIGAYKQMG